MPFIPHDAIHGAAGQISLHGVFEQVGAVTEEHLMALLDDPYMVGENLGDMIDPYRTIRGPGIGRPSTF